MGDGEAAPHEFVDRVAEPELQIVTLGEFSERLGEKDQSLAVEAQPGEQRLVEDENHRQARIEREGRIGRAQRLCRQPDSVGAAWVTISSGPVRSTSAGQSTETNDGSSGQASIGQASRCGQRLHNPGARFSTCQRLKP